MKATSFHESRHLNDSELTDVLLQCPICESNNFSTSLELQKNPTVNLNCCNNCYVSFASRLPTRKAIEEYYSNYYDSTNNNDARITNDNYANLAKHIFDSFSISGYSNKKEIYLLDFGGGDGTLALEVAKHIYEVDSDILIHVHVYDFESSIVSSSRTNIVISKIEHLNENSYDYIIASAVLEHLVDPIENISSLIKFSNQGLIYIRTPYVLPLAKLFQMVKLKLDFTYPAHLFDMGDDFWNWIAKEMSLDIISSRPSPVETTFKNNVFRTAIAYLFKMPWYIFKNKYKLVGGWEVIYKVRQ